MPKKNHVDPVVSSGLSPQSIEFDPSDLIPLEEVGCDPNRESHFLSPSELELPYVPEGKREPIRALLAPVLSKLKLASGDCWRVAQEATQLANDSRVQYVEGVWTRSKDNPYYSEEEFEPVPHAWNMVDGHFVDLVAEWYRWRSFGDDAPWLHEPLHVFSLEDFARYESMLYKLDGLSLAGTILEEGYAAEFGMEEDEYLGGGEAFYFRRAVGRLRARYMFSSRTASRRGESPSADAVGLEKEKETQ